jgi:para-nitrobenzyl esterase
MVWIHGGALVTGCVKDALTEASDLALQGTSTGGPGQIVVELQYRLGVMGFFALPELQPEDPNGSVGNYGLLDQALALQWVHDNAAAFGGDPNNVTIFGESAGGFSTYILEASPIAKANYSRVISESGMYGQAIPLQPGVGAPSDAFPDPNATAFPRGIHLASNASLGCTDPGTRVACMRAFPASSVFSAWNTSGGGSLIGGGAASPAVDGYVLTEQASQMILESVTPPKPLLLGSNANELTIFTLTSPSLPACSDYENAVRSALGTVAGNTVLGIYPCSAFASPIAAYRRVFEDILFVCPTFQAGKLVSDKGSTSYVYHFEYGPNAVLGAFHAFELFYVFGNTGGLSSVGITPDAGDALLSDAMQTAWTSYADNGVPIATPTWGPFAPGPGNPASLGSAFVWNLDAGNNLINSYVQAGTLRDGRCAQLALPANNLNSDFDSFTNDRDNCPFATNSDQADAGSIGTDPSDGIGDRCQCGDVTDNGIVDSADVALLRTRLAGGPPLSIHGVSKCNVESSSAACDIVDVAVMRRRLATPALGPGIQQVCAAANPA